MDTGFTTELDKLSVEELTDLKEQIQKKIYEKEFSDRQARLSRLLYSGRVLAIACPHCKGTGNVEIEHMGSDNMDIDYTTESCEYCNDGAVYGVSFEHRDQYDKVCESITDAECMMVDY